MEPSRFIKQNKPLWTELEEMLGAIGKRRKTALRADRIDRFTELYKAVSAHLAAMQTYRPHDETTLYLNQLVARAHNLLYNANNSSVTQLKDFFAEYFPKLLQARLPFVGFAALLFVFGGLLGFFAVWRDPLNLHLIVPESIASHIDPTATDLPRDNLQSPLMSTTIMLNNIRVAIMAFLSGITLGVGTIYLLVFNGLLIGALAAVFMQAGQSYVFWAYILPHGIIELTAIFIAGGAGLYMGYRFFVPGPYSRKRMFLESARESVQLLIGTVPLFIVAGLIEGYITPATLPLAAKYGVAAITLLLLAAYYVFGTIRKRRRQEQGQLAG
ncbi:stage II sporulation protein M [Paenibacillus athensensis]|uniref:Stage II sporulation protein M n=1 Tax=Paenibacillus athensensis TaxID=1967502 RepID=A0A4Y8Q052_9BACL|nr:stage II sporulation protein M [Paenibacillus athensensis]MCD1261107.1 stage II sporulation protein M [Paenibacillus athensensis]